MTSLQLRAVASSVLLAWPIAHGQPSPAPAPVRPIAVLPEPAEAFPPGVAVPAAAPSAPADASRPDASEPRIIRGNDRVINTSRQPRAIQGKPASFKFEDAPIADVVGVVLGEILAVDYVLHGQITGNVTLATRAPVPADQAMFLLESALQTNGLVMARDSRGTYHVGRPDALRGIVSAPRQVVGGALPPGQGAIIVPLQYIGAGEMATILRPMMAADSLVRVDTVRNLLILSGTRTQAEGWLDIVNTFDVDLLKGMSVGVFPLKYASVAEVEAALRLVSGGGAGAAAPGAPGAPGAGAAQQPAMLGESNPFFGAIRVMPIQRINSILVVTPRAAYLEEARRWIEKLDRPSDNSAEAGLHVYPVQNGTARHLAELIGTLYGGTADSARSAPTGNGVAPGQGVNIGGTGGFGTALLGGGVPGGTSSAFGLAGGGGVGGGIGLQAQGQRAQGQGTQAGSGVSGVTIGQGNVRVIADEVNNAVLVYGPRSEFTKIEATLKRLDVRAPQVLIEANIIEVTLNNDLRYGLQFAFNNGLNGDYSGRGALGTLPTTALGAAGSGFSYTLTNGANTVKAVLSALAEKSLIKVISSPSLMVLDNNTASIVVGNQEPIKTGDTIVTGGIVSSNIQYKDTGVALQVTPTVNAGNIITMLLNQSVTDIGAADSTTTAGNPRFLQRSINSKVAVKSGESIVMGGLIRDNSSTGRSGIPLLQDIPVVGSAFSTTTTNQDRTELIVIITPRVMRADADIRELSNELRERMRGLAVIEGYSPARPDGVLPAPPVGTPRPEWPQRSGTGAAPDAAP